VDNQTGPANTDQVISAMFGWAVLFVMLTVASDIPEIGKLAAAFAWLLLISITIIYGPDAFDNVNRFVDPSRTAKSPTQGGSTG